MSNIISLFWFVVISVTCVFTTNAEIKDEKDSAIEKTRLIIKEITEKSYPEINLKKIRVKTFESDRNFFKARFSFGRFLAFQKMRHLVFVNPKIFELNAPEKGIKAIIAHELAHLLYYTKKNRLELLGLARLASGSFTAKFERKADLETIKRGYGNGLIAYRKWLYDQIPIEEVTSKKKNYFSPKEINLIIKATKDKPEFFDLWRKNIPKNINEIKKSIKQS